MVPLQNKVKSMQGKVSGSFDHLNHLNTSILHPRPFQAIFHRFDNLTNIYSLIQSCTRISTIFDMGIFFVVFIKKVSFLFFLLQNIWNKNSRSLSAPRFLESGHPKVILFFAKFWELKNANNKVVKVSLAFKGCPHKPSASLSLLTDKSSLEDEIALHWNCIVCNG